MGSRQTPRRTSRRNSSDAYLNSMTASILNYTCMSAARTGRVPVCLLLFLTFLAGASLTIFARQTSGSDLTPMQREIERQRLRLSSSETEERRDALMRLGWMKRPEASRVAALALNDASEIVRATATGAVLSLPPDEAAAVLLPLLQDKKEFVRQEAAYALGQTRSRMGVAGLVTLLERDKLPGVRGAAAVALGLIADESAAGSLARTLDPSYTALESSAQKRRSKKEDNEFVLRAAARALGQIRSRVAVPALVSVMANERADDDLRREAARALGLIGDSSAVPALRAVLADGDPYLSRIAYEALLKISPADAGGRPS